MSIRISVASAIAGYTETPEEERANVLSHGAGLLFALIVAGPLIARAIPHGTTAVWAIAFFALAQIFTYASSTFYHASRPGRARRFFLVCDHVAIFALIAGT